MDTLQSTKNRIEEIFNERGGKQAVEYILTSLKHERSDLTNEESEYTLSAEQQKEYESRKKRYDNLAKDIKEIEERLESYKNRQKIFTTPIQELTHVFSEEGEMDEKLGKLSKEAIQKGVEMVDKMKQEEVRDLFSFIKRLTLIAKNKSKNYNYGALIAENKSYHITNNVIEYLNGRRQYAEALDRLYDDKDDPWTDLGNRSIG